MNEQIWTIFVWLSAIFTLFCISWGEYRRSLVGVCAVIVSLGGFTGQHEFYGFAMCLVGALYFGSGALKNLREVETTSKKPVGFGWPYLRLIPNWVFFLWAMWEIVSLIVHPLR